MLKEKYPENKTAIRVMVVDSDKSPLMPNTWTGRPTTTWKLIWREDFKEGTLEISDKEYMAAVEKAGASEKLNTKVGIL